MIEKYLDFLHRHDGYFYEWVPHVMKKSEKWEFYLKEGIWTIGIYRGDIKPIAHTDILKYCQENHIDLIVLESLLCSSLITTGMYLLSKEETDSPVYGEICSLVDEKIIVESLENMKKQLGQIVESLKKPKLTLLD